MLNKILALTRKSITSEQEVKDLTNLLNVPYYRMANVHLHNKLQNKILENPVIEKWLIKLLSNILTTMTGSEDFMKKYCKEVFYQYTALHISIAQDYTIDSLNNFLSKEQQVFQLLFIINMNFKTIEKSKEN